MKKLFIMAIFITFLLPSFVFAKEDYSRIDIKVGPSIKSKEELILKSDNEFEIITADGSLNSKTKSKELKVIFNGDKINLQSDKFTLNNFPDNGLLLINSNSPINISKTKRNYKGSISFRINDKKLDVINNIDMENYLKGVLPKEMSPSFPLEALKAQALCSRSFAINNYNKYIKKGYNLDDTTNSQVYYGSDVEKESTNKAVELTKEEIVNYNGKVASTIFGASSGGFIASANEVWGGNNHPYLISKEDPYSTYTWEYELKDSDLNKLNIKNAYDCKIECSNDSKRTSNITFSTPKGEVAFRGNEFRSKLGNTKVKSTLFEVDLNNGKINIKGKGYGHGVGMSQYGAVEMAKKGFNYKEIIEFYFPGTEIGKLS
ncbi:SpoIID/LytB domain-containing protein [Peptoniphilus sp. MSJ-1]|uniref:SpoIID/LytB domain-containing protein n=1 Tax=Peptoniphilus ovalis TaxID=2841503 RepID=A0ABS6FIG3_9FIRM|nr:SpoIID/LytB domain-containing protein [Peptoniphilus ovalis]MBU5669016.1 SpoIID/LytB domain-containing protein [Peptoniphilus ovalis]